MILWVAVVSIFDSSVACPPASHFTAGQLFAYWSFCLSWRNSVRRPMVKPWLN